jgi:hypothetical protein
LDIFRIGSHKLGLSWLLIILDVLWIDDLFRSTFSGTFYLRILKNSWPLSVQSLYHLLSCQTFPSHSNCPFIIIFNFPYCVLGEFLSSIFQSSNSLFNCVLSRTSPSVEILDFSFLSLLIVPVSCALILVHFFPYLLGILNIAYFLTIFILL